MGVVLLAGFIMGLYFYACALDRKTDKDVALGALPPPKERITIEQAPRFLDTVSHRDVYSTSFDGLKLHAITVPQNEKSWVILMHGYTSAARGMGNPARRFHAMGYSLLLPDARGHGQSEGDYIDMGYFSRKDIVMWVEQLLRVHPDADVLLYGISMGGAAVMMAAGEALPRQVKGVIEDCGFSSIFEEMRHQMIHIFHYPACITDFTLFFADLVTRLRAGYSLHDGDACAQLQKASLPMLFLHGEADRYVPFAMLDKVYTAAATQDKKKVCFPDATHGAAAVVDPDTYWGEIGAFAGRIAPLRP